MKKLVILMEKNINEKTGNINEKMLMNK